MDAGPASLAPGPSGGRLSGAELLAVAGGAIALSLAVAVVLHPLALADLAIVSMVGFALPPLLVARRRGDARRVLGLHPPPVRALVGAALIGSALWLPVLALVGPLLEHLPDRAATEEALAPLADGTTPLAVRLAVFALVPAVAEELLCRGVLCRHLVGRLGAGPAVAVSTLYFAALHMSLTQGLPALFTGAALGLVAVRTRSTVTAMVLHLVNNACILVLATPGSGLTAAIEAAPGTAGAVAMTLLGVGFLLVRGSPPSPETLP